MRIEGGFFRRQIAEIERSGILRIYGVFLSCVHAVTWIFWHGGRVAEQISDTVTPQCWPFFPGCQSVRVLSPFAVDAALSLYLVLSLLAAILFAFSRVRPGYWLLLALSAFKLAFHLQDYRLMGNYHYMPHLVTFAYLLLPQKQSVAKVLIGIFYVSAGMLKLNSEWLSGASIGRTFPWGGTFLLQWSAAYVVFLELFFVFWLFARDWRIRMAGWLQFLIFHLTSWYFVGYFYPIIMLLLVVIFPLDWLSPPPGAAPGLRLASMSRRNWVFLGLVCLCQLPSKLSERDPVLFGNLRILGLNMYDARSVCEAGIYMREGDGTTIEYVPDFNSLGPRIHCDPILFVNEAWNICKERRQAGSGGDIDLYLTSRRSTDLESTPVLEISNFCQRARGAGWVSWLAQSF